MPLFAVYGLHGVYGVFEAIKQVPWCMEVARHVPINVIMYKPTTDSLNIKQNKLEETPVKGTRHHKVKETTMVSPE